MRDVRAATFSLVFLMLVSPAAAQSGSAGARDGFVIGFGVGFGAAYPCDTCPSGAASFYVGAMAAPQVAVLAEFSGVFGSGDDSPSFDSRGERGLGVLAIGARFWPTERFWLQAGVGIGGSFDENFDDDFDNRDDRSWAGVVGAGFDVTRKGRFALDVHVRGAFIENRQSVALGIGFNWY